MLVLDAEQIKKLAPTGRVIDALRDTFRSGSVTTERVLTPMPGGDSNRFFLSMLAMEPLGISTIKLVTILPENPAEGRPTVQGAIVVFAKTGEAIAILDGTIVTQLRTGAASALASQYLSREDSARLLIVGTGALAPLMAISHCAVRPIREVKIWGRRPDQAAAAAALIRSSGLPEVEVSVAEDLAVAVFGADIVSCCTSSSQPLIAGRWLRPGTHVDLVGAFQPTMRETDDDVVRQSRIFVDTFKGALHEGGDVVDPLSRGIITREQIEGELADLVRGVFARRSADEITLFKSVGTPIEDLATARMVVEAAGAARS